MAVTARNRGIHAVPQVLENPVAELQDQGLSPFVMPTMGSRGGANAEDQLETLESLRITPETINCEFRSSMAVEKVGEDMNGRRVFAAIDALEADAILLVNRVKAHTDYDGEYEGDLAKMAVVGLDKHRGAEEMYNAALARGFPSIVPERVEILIHETPIVGEIALIENASERVVEIVGLPVNEIMDREPELLE